jgi:hypothetical protein
MDALFTAISQVGFPIVVSVLLLIRVESSVTSLKNEISQLKETIIKLTTIIDERLGRKA